MKITIIGGGNIGTQFAVHCAVKGHDTTIFSSKAALFNKVLEIVNENNDVILVGKVKAVDSYKEACLNADIIFVTYPAPMMEQLSVEFEQYINEGVYIGLVPGTGGGECAFSKYIDKGCVVFGLQRVPSVARLVEYGKRVKATGYRDTLHISALPNSYTEKCCEIVSGIFDMPCIALPNYLNVTLTPSNPILHTTRLYSLFKNYKIIKWYDSIPLFYEEWDDDSSKILFKCDEEVQKICTALSYFDLSFVKSLREHYESKTPENLTAKIRSINSLKGIKTPTVEQNGKFAPDFSSRYFTADFPYGLEIINQIAKLVKVEIPNCEMVLDWYYSISKSNSKFFYSKWGIDNYELFVKFYIK